MSGAALPYHLRPHKSVDRRLFLDLLARYERWKPVSDFAYVSMGAYPLEDHKLIHRQLGITRLLAFDYEETVVARQIFNKPVMSCYCRQLKSGDLIDNFDTVLGEAGFSDAAGVIVWLDYTDPKKIGQQIREFQTLLDKLRVGDVVRITVNAHPNSLSDPATPGKPPPLATDKMKGQFQNLKNWIGEYLPSDAAAEDMTHDGLPGLIASSFAAAALKALPVSGGTIFCPLSIMRYADGVQMLSMTGAVVAKVDKAKMLSRLDLASWPFATTDWKTIHRLVVPALTVRERLFLEKGIATENPDELIKGLGFDTAADVSMKDFLDSYKDYYRFYPTLLSAEL